MRLSIMETETFSTKNTIWFREYQIQHESKGTLHCHNRAEIWARVVPWLERSLVVRWVVGSILHGVPIVLFLVPASAPRLM